MKFMRITLLDTVLLSPLINACGNYFWEKIIFREKLSPSEKNLIFDSSDQNWPPTVIRSLPSSKSHGVGQVALRYPRIFSSYFILIKESTFWWITFQHETVRFQQHAFMATSWQWTNPYLFIFTILWFLRLSTSCISENKRDTLRIATMTTHGMVDKNSGIWWYLGCGLGVRSKVDGHGWKWTVQGG